MKTFSLLKIKAIVSFALLISFCGLPTQAQQMLWFGTVKMAEQTMQGRFEILKDSLIKRIVYAPYGLRPTEFQNVREKDKELRFSWLVNNQNYSCLLLKSGSSSFAGDCTSANNPTVKLSIREFNPEDAMLQGNSLPAGQKDIQILDRALILLNYGKNWNRLDNRVCDGAAYPYKWSLFCALHQASIDVDAEYRHLRPAMQAARQAIEEASSGKKYAHLLQDYNNEVKSFDSIANVLNRAKQILEDKIKSQK